MKHRREGTGARREGISGQLSLIKFTSFICGAQTQEFLAQLLMTFMVWSRLPKMVEESDHLYQGAASQNIIKRSLLKGIPHRGKMVEKVTLSPLLAQIYHILKLLK